MVYFIIYIVIKPRNIQIKQKTEKRAKENCPKTTTNYIKISIKYIINIKIIQLKQNAIVYLSSY